MFYYNNYIVWIKMHVYCTVLKLNIGYVFVVLLNLRLKEYLFEMYLKLF
jgi:hypothetical protein